MNISVDVSDFCTIENFIWLDQKPQSEMGVEPKILFEHIIEEDLFEICCKCIGKKNPDENFFGKNTLFFKKI